MKKPKAGDGCIYLLTNLANSKRYVGQYKAALNVERRYKRHIDVAFTSGDSRPLYRALRKAWRASKGETLGFSAEIVWVGSCEKLHDKERFFVKKFHSYINDSLGNKSYNLTIGGDGVTGHVWSKKARQNLCLVRRAQFEDGTVAAKMSIAQLRRYEDPLERARQGKVKTPQECAALSAAQTRRYKNPEERAKTGEASRRAHAKDPSLSIRMSEAQLRRYEKPEEREKQAMATSRRYENPREREKQRAIQNRRFEDPEERRKTGEHSRRMWDARTPEERSAIGFKAADTRRRNAALRKSK